MRAPDRMEITRLRFTNGVEALEYAFRHAIIRKTALVDDKIAAMWGVCGAPLSVIGQPYLLTTYEVEKAPLTFVKTFRKETQEMLTYFPVLENYVDATYTRAVKLLQLAGYTVEPAEPLFGSGAMFRKFFIKADH